MNNGYTIDKIDKLFLILLEYFCRTIDKEYYTYIYKITLFFIK